MYKRFFIILLWFCTLNCYSQGIYNEESDGIKQLDSAITRAETENKFVMVQVGGNWCKWCRMLNEFIENDSEIKELINANFVFIHLNYSPKNKNTESMVRLGNPQRFGFPVIVILDGKGQRIHTQNTAYLEKDNGYDRKKVLDMLKQWTPSALK